MNDNGDSYTVNGIGRTKADNITFRSLKSNKTHKREYTTHKSFMPSLKNQSASDKILCYDVEFEKVEDIDVSTIEKYVPLQRLS